MNTEKKKASDKRLLETNLSSIGNSTPSTSGANKLK